MSVSEKSLIILQHISEGWTYEQILRFHPEFTYMDIFNAAKEILVAHAAANQPGESSNDWIDSDYTLLTDDWIGSQPSHSMLLTDDWIGSQPSHPPVPRSRDERVNKIREKYPRAYVKWSDEENMQVKRLFQAGKSAREIADILQRQRGAIQSRLFKLGLSTHDPFAHRKRKF